MGQPKLLLPWGDKSILGHILHQWRQLGAAQIAPVCRPDDKPLITELNRLGLPAADRVLNSRPESGMFTSIQSAANWTGWNSNLTHFVIALGDQPQIQSATLSALLQFAGDHPHFICQPTFQGRAKHPVLLPARIFHDLVVSPASTFRDFLQSHTAHRRSLELPDESLNLDLDSPEDYVAARKRFAPPNT
jgi:molybdenum cofactor cytidylyltransferase